MSLPKSLYILLELFSVSKFQSAWHSRDSECEVICHKHGNKIWNEYKMFPFVQQFVCYVFCINWTIEMIKSWFLVGCLILLNYTVETKVGCMFRLQTKICVCVVMRHVHQTKICVRVALPHVHHFEKLGLERTFEILTCHICSRNIFSAYSLPFHVQIFFSFCDTYCFLMFWMNIFYNSLTWFRCL